MEKSKSTKEILRKIFMFSILLERFKMEKRGQFYIAAAIILIAVIFGFATISNYSKMFNTVDIEDESYDLSLEVQKIFDSGLEQGLGDEEINDNLKHYVESYSKSSDLPTDFYFVFGDDTSVEVSAYVESEDMKEIKISSLDVDFDKYNSAVTSVNLTSNNYTTIDKTFNPASSDSIFFKIDNSVHAVDIETGRNFHYVISRDIKGEKHIIVK